MPAPGQMTRVTGKFEPARMAGMRIDPRNPFNFYFLINKGEQSLTLEAQKAEYNKLIKYFLASLTIPNRDMWVNLSPSESDRIIPDNFARTETGHALLAQDYLLKQFTSSLMHPEDPVGKEFWTKIYAKAFEKFGTTEIPIDTFNKVWITADRADIYQKDDTALLVDSHLKVMLQQDFMAIRQNKEQYAVAADTLAQESDGARQMTSDLVREVIIPVMENEINTGSNFAQVRQIYNSMILATWYKKTLRKSLLGQIYADKSKAAGIETSDPQAREKIYQQYLEAFQLGAFNYIKNDTNPSTQETLPRKYFSGGVALLPDAAMIKVVDERSARNQFLGLRNTVEVVTTLFTKTSRLFPLLLLPANSLTYASTTLPSTEPPDTDLIATTLGMIHSQTAEFMNLLNNEATGWALLGIFLVSVPLILYHAHKLRIKIALAVQIIDTRTDLLSREDLLAILKEVYRSDATTSSDLDIQFITNSMQKQNIDIQTGLAALISFFSLDQEHRLLEVNATAYIANIKTNDLTSKRNRLNPLRHAAEISDIERRIHQSEQSYMQLEKAIDALTPPDSAALQAPTGGIDLDEKYLTMNIRVDGKGMPLPVSMQDPAMLDIDGLSPFIREIEPVTPLNMPVFLELTQSP